MTEHSQPATRQRLLDAAGEVFAERGFRLATVRDICQRAGANIAAINYHFRDKEGLYAAVLRDAHQAAHEKYPPTLGLTAHATPEERLRAFVRSLLARMLDLGRPAWHGLLMAREMLEPTAAFDTFITDSIRPRYRLLAEIVRDLCPAADSDEKRNLLANSIVGQCLHYHHARHLLARLLPGQRWPTDVDRLTDHIVRFSLAALKSKTLFPRTTP
ncbi:MAG: CerR family C-terminal domain-containing protein [Phycisphaerae bacterium]|nr:CerR family C-terminal domain-containing protein [Phycisphaerae bacterium]HQL53649.1 CerR family C-terminal domain-containing protein [Phycisphaerae bacterium]